MKRSGLSGCLWKEMILLGALLLILTGCRASMDDAAVNVLRNGSAAVAEQQETAAAPGSDGQELPVTEPAEDVDALPAQSEWHNAEPASGADSKLIQQEKTFAELEEYILKDSGTRLLTEEDIADLTVSSLELARNEIFARHGYVFTNENYKSYFSSRYWYKENKDYSERLLSDIEKQNVLFLKQQADRGKAYFKQAKGGTALVDLNTDGRKDTVVLECEPGGDSFKLNVNGQSITGTGDNLDGVMFICDIDTGDGYKEIAVTESGPSSDEATYFFYYDGGGINFMGKVQGSGSVVWMTGNGTFSTKTRGNILHTWFFTDHYRLSSSHRLENVPQQYYRMNTVVTVRQELKLQKSPADAATAVVLEPGEDVLLTRSDNREWCEVQNSEGITGWFAVEGFNTVRGTDMSASDYFEGLNFAD